MRVEGTLVLTTHSKCIQKKRSGSGRGSRLCIDILLPTILPFSFIPSAKADVNCETLAEYYLDFAKPDNAPDKDMRSSGYYMGLVWGFLNGDSRRTYRPPNDLTVSQASHVVGSWLRSNPQHGQESHVWCVHYALKETWPAD